MTDSRNAPTVLRMLRTCTCGTEFHGRADATYCSAACRQKSYRARIEPRDYWDNPDAQAETVNMIAHSALAPKVVERYDPAVKLALKRLLEVSLSRLEESCARDKADGLVTAAQARKIAKLYG